jgi:hypothetical protein
MVVPSDVHCSVPLSWRQGRCDDFALRQYLRVLTTASGGYGMNADRIPAGAVQETDDDEQDAEEDE